MIIASLFPLTSIAAHSVAEGNSTASISVIALIVAVIALLLHYFSYKQLSGLKLTSAAPQTISVPKPAENKIEPTLNEVVTSNVAVAGNEGVYAAIAAAIHLYGEELHDVENTVLTINKVSRTYSPWSSKIHGLNTYFKR